MDDYSKLIPYLISEFGDFDVFQKHLNQDIDYSKASFNLVDSEITSWEEVGNVKHIGGELNLFETSITSLGDLQTVGGHLDLRNTSITSLGNLQSVGGYLLLYNSSFTSLGNLESVGRFLDLRNTSNLIDLGNLKEVKGIIYYNKGTKVEELLKERGLI